MGNEPIARRSAPLIPRFRLRTLFLLIAVVVALLAWPINQGHKQGRVTAELADLQAEWYYGFEHPRTSGRRPWVGRWARPATSQPSWRGNYFSSIRVIYVDDDSLSDESLERLATLSSIQALHVKSKQITDRGLANLSGLPNLESLFIHSALVTDNGIARLATLPALRELWIRSPLLTDRGMATLATLGDLRVLHVASPHIGDAGVARLKTLNKLRQLGLWETAVTDPGLQTIGEMRVSELTVADTPITDIRRSQTTACNIFRIYSCWNYTTPR